MPLKNLELVLLVTVTLVRDQEHALLAVHLRTDALVATGVVLASSLDHVVRVSVRFEKVMEVELLISELAVPPWL